MKILITGAAGFIGSHTAEFLQEKEFEVIGVDNFSKQYEVSLKERNVRAIQQKGVEMIRMDLRNPEEYSALPTDFEFMVHFAAQPGISQSSSFHDYFSNNLEATQHLVEFAKRNNSLKHFLYISTSSVYGLEATFPETVAPRPASWYGVSKLAAEQLVLAQSREGKLRASSLRLFSVYGPRERPEKLFSKIISCALHHRVFPIFEGSEKHLRSFTYVGDIVSGIHKALQRHEELDGEIINLGAEDEHKTSEGIELVESLMGTSIELQTVPRRPGDQFRTLANIAKAKKLLGYQPTTSLKDGLQLQIDWFKENDL